VARELGISPAPVLEAMVRLQEEGLLEVLPRRGTRVRIITPDYLLGQLLVREALECEAARLACGAPVRQARRMLLHLAAGVHAADRSSVAMWQREVEFHLAIVRLVGVPEFVQAYERVMRVGLFMRINQITGHVPLMKSHAALVDALAEDDPDAAERAMREHIRAGKEIIFAPIEKARHTPEIRNST